MSSSTRANKGKASAQNEGDDIARGRGGRSGKQSRAQVAEEINRAYAEQLQQQEEEEYFEEVGRQEELMNRQSQQQSNTGEDEEEVEAPPSTRPLVSDIFRKHFKKLPRVVPDSTSSNNDPAADTRIKYNAYCNYCKNVYKWMSGGGYGTLRRHMETCHPTEYGISQSQTQIRGTTTSVTGTPSNPLFKYDHNHAEDVMSRYCAMEKQPFNYADRITYETSIKDAYCPPAKKISRSNMLRRIRRQTFDKKTRVNEIFSTFRS